MATSFGEEFSATMDVKTLCLGVLTEGNKSGYEIKRCFEEAFSHFFVAGFGSIYPALAELSRAGLVTCENARSPAYRAISSTANSGSWSGTTIEARSRGSGSSHFFAIQSLTARAKALAMQASKTSWTP
jgi:hypothetical protein